MRLTFEIVSGRVVEMDGAKPGHKVRSVGDEQGGFAHYALVDGEAQGPFKSLTEAFEVMKEDEGHD